jgi:pyruvate/2-oxoglutarate dehydrogenase complex dihydrolipoamide dehydrogenase (E3) component
LWAVEKRKRSYTLDASRLIIATGTSENALSFPGCRNVYIPELGGRMPLHDAYMRSSNQHVYVVGDTAGVEEASTAMEEGRLAGIHAAWSLGCMTDSMMEDRVAGTRRRLDALRQGVFGKKRFDAKLRILEESRTP